jgi:diacylglycerol O-acyltransferase
VPRPMSPADSLFLTVESRQTPMHVGGLQLFRPAADFGSVRDYVQTLMVSDDVAPLFRKRARRSLTSAAQWGWEPDGQFDIDYHVRHNSLPRPGRVRELLALCSRLHSTLLDRARPPWEMHVIEGLDDGRFALYFKIHHALIDGVSAQRLLQSVLTRDPLQRNLPAPWANRPTPAQLVAAEEARGGRGLLELPVGVVRSALELAADAAGLPSALVKSVNRSIHDQSAPLSFAAPKSMFNVPITGARRFAAQSWPLERIRRIRKSTGVTVNDVVLAVCSGALRGYMESLGALPDDPLIAMVPVALRPRGREAGNAVGAVMCNLGTDRSDPADRLHVVHHSMEEGKKALHGMSPLQIMAMTGIGMSPLLLQTIPGLADLVRPPFNLIISNVPGPRVPLYLDGARLDGIYPLSIPYHGQALNITCTSYADQLAFGLTGCRRRVPHLQRLLGHLDEELGALEKAVGA